MKNDINVWDIDTVNVIDPKFSLSGHSDSVLGLSLNKINRKILASVSADKTCKLWDLETKTSTQTFESFKGIVTSSSFHPFEENILLVGDAKGKASLIDIKSGSVKKWNICRDDIEKVLWNKYNPYTFLCGTSTGSVISIDCRNENAHHLTLKAHNESISGMELRYYRHMSSLFINFTNSLILAICVRAVW